MWMACFGEEGRGLLGSWIAVRGDQVMEGVVTWSEGETEPRARVMGTAGRFLMPQTRAAQGARGAAGGRGCGGCGRLGGLSVFCLVRAVVPELDTVTSGREVWPLGQSCLLSWPR